MRTKFKSYTFDTYKILMVKDSKQATAEPFKITKPDDVYTAIYKKYYKNLAVEMFGIVLLDSGNHVIAFQPISTGTLNASLVHPREVFVYAINALAASIILTHNHPSGNIAPSTEDILITEQLKQAGKIMGIPIRDHVILCDGGRFSSLANLGYL